MPDDIERLIYKIELDDSGYVRGVESMSLSTSRLASIQDTANKKLQETQLQLKSVADVFEKDRKALENYSGTDSKVRKVLEDNLKASLTQHEKLQAEVKDLQAQYDQATKAAQQFAEASLKATTLQQTTTGGKIPIPGATLPTQPLPIIPELTGIINQIPELSELPDILARTSDEFEQLRITISAAEQALQTLDPASEDFQNLNAIIAQGKNVLEQYDGATKQASGSQASLRTQLRQAREELVRLEQAGKGASAEYLELEKRTAKLTDAFNDQQQRIRILASDTKLLDFGKGAITAATSAFQAYTSVAILVGNESEDLQKKTMQLFAAMQLLQALEQLSNLTRREGVLATLAQSAANRVFNTTVTASANAVRGFRSALIATGIGAAAIAIGFLVQKFIDYKNAAHNASEEQKLLKEVNDKAIDSYSEQVSKLQILERQLKDTNIPQQQRIDLAREYNKTADEGNRIDLKQIENTDLVTSAIGRQILKIKERALEQARANVTTEKATALFKAEAALVEVLPTFTPDVNVAEQVAEAVKKLGTSVKDLNLASKLSDVSKAFDAFNKAADLAANKTLPDLIDPKSVEAAKKRIQDQIDVLKLAFGKLAEVDIVGREANLAAQKKLEEELAKLEGKTKTTTTRAAVENVFKQEMDKLNADLAALNADTLTTIQKINDEFAAKLVVEQNRIEKLIKEKKLTGKAGDTLKPETQAGQLFELSVKINTQQRDKELADNEKKILDARKKLNDELDKLERQATENSINLIADEFDRRRQLIDFNEKNEVEDFKAAQAARLALFDENSELIFGKDFKNNQEFIEKRAELVTNGEIELNNIIAKFSGLRQDLSQDIFQRSITTLQTILDKELLKLDEANTAKIQEQKALLASGAINYKQFQENVTEILRIEKAKRDQLRLEELKAELENINKLLFVTTDAKDREKLEEQQRNVSQKISDIKRENPSEETDDGTKQRIEQIQAYVESISQLANAVIGFWQQANQAEREALDRSISIQQERVEAAQRIAERGNASYLKAESDRLKELQVARENAARKQLGIDAALQASQLLVGITGAISRIATTPFGAETIADIAIIVAALATGYGIIKSLQGNQPKFKTGTTHVERSGNKPGTDTIPAWLTEGEAVIPVEKNKKYKKAVEAIYHEKIPADVLNEFVQNYVTNKTTYHKTDDKKITTKDEISNIIHKVLNETADKKFTLNEVNNVISGKKKNELISVIKKLVDEKVNKESISTDLKNSLVNKSISIDEVNKFSEIINKIVNEKLKTDKENNIIINRSNSNTDNNTVSNKSDLKNFEETVIKKTVNENVYKKFVENVSKIPAKVLTSFINNYHSTEKMHVSDTLLARAEYTKYRDVSSDTVRYDFKAIENKVFDRTNSEIKELTKTISPEHFNQFISTHHTIKPLPLPNYERIKQVNEIKMSHDGKMAGLLDEQNRLLKENNDLHRETHRSLRAMGISVNMDKDGIAISVMEAAEQIKKNKRL